MTDPTPLDDIMLDRLLGKVDAPEIAPDFADRVAAEAARVDRPITTPSLPPRVRAVRRPWTRRSMWAGVVAINLIVASAIAATLTGVAPRFAHVVAAAAHVLHIHRHETPPPHIAPPPIRRMARAAPAPVDALAQPTSFARPLPPARAPVLRPRLERARQRPEFGANRGLHSRFSAGEARRTERRWPGGGRAERLKAGRQAERVGPAMTAQDQFGPRGFDRGPGAGEMRGPWAQTWRGPQRQGLGPWRQRGQGGWRRPGRGGGRGMGWRRPFGRGRRF